MIMQCLALQMGGKGTNRAKKIPHDGELLLRIFLVYMTPALLNLVGKAQFFR